MTMHTTANPDALPQPMGEFKPVDEWQAHIGLVFYGLRGRRVQDYYQTFASADYRLAHALAQDYYDRVRKRDKASGNRSSLIVHEWGPGNGNLAACFLTRLKVLDKDGLVYPRVRYVLVDLHQPILDNAQNHPDLIPHKE